MDRFFLKWIFLLSLGIPAAACTRIDPEVRAFLSALKPPPTDEEPVVDPFPVSSIESVQGTSLGYEISGGSHAYKSRLEVVNEGAPGTVKTPTRQYLVVWDLQSGEELKSEGVFDNLSGFNP